MKVALLSDCYLPRLGGIEVQVHDLAAHLVGAGHEVEVFTATAGEDGQRGGQVEEVDGVAVHRFALPLPYGVPVNPLAPPEVRRRLRAGGFDVAHVHMGVVSPFAMDMARVSIGIGLPTAVTWHCLLDRSRPLMSTAGYARRWAHRGAALSAVSGMAAARVADIAGGATVGVLPNGIDVATWAPAEGALTGEVTQPGQTVRVAAAMRLARRKRPGDLVSVVAEAVARLPEGRRLQVDVFGDGPQRAHLQSRIEQLGLADTIRLRGRVDRAQLRSEYQHADLFLSTTALEAFGIAGLEARTAGLPVVARRGTGMADFVTDGVNGRLADADGLADALVELVVDDALRQAMSQVNRVTAPTQSWPLVVESTLAEYRRAGATS